MKNYKEETLLLRIKIKMEIDGLDIDRWQSIP